ncbi:DUF4142 domain-containing protein [Nakamurella sp. GG22]
MRTAVQRVLGGAAAITMMGVLTLGAAGAAAADTNDQDLAFITANGQTNLAEIAIGKLALERAVNDSTLELAQMTLTDHQAALAKLEGVAGDLGVALPTEPSPEQQAQAATLEGLTGQAFDEAYAQIQVAGHQASVQKTETELSGGSEQAVLDYAEGYLPVAQMHLQMSQDLVAELGLTPGSVPAGTGGGAGTTPLTTMVWQAALVALAVAMLGGGVVLIRRQTADR